jgi:cyclopropane fatty-acyl-phospholipid synthase-like methyltransferase
MNQKPNFDRLAPVYRLLETISFGNSLSRCRSDFLDQLDSCRNALVIGDGDGRFTASLLERNPNIRIDAIDSSRAMLLTLVQNAGPNAIRVRIHHADARQFIPPNSPYDLIVSHFFLDCLTTEEVANLAHRLRTCVTPSSRWIVSEFAIPKNWFGRILARPIITGLYLAFWFFAGIQVFRLPNHREALTGAGFQNNLSRNSLAGLLVTEMWAPAELS